MNDPDKNKDKREFPRANFPCDFTLWPEGKNDDVILGNAANVSAGGLSAFIHKSFEAGETGEIKIDSSHLSEPVYCRWKAVRSEKDSSTADEWKNYYKIAIQFTDLDEQRKLALVNLVKYLLEMEEKNKK